jgi:hypothetical protein
MQVSAAPPVHRDPPVEIPAPVDAEAPNIEGVAASPMVEKPMDEHQAQEQIERMSMVKNGGPDAVSAMQDALKMLPKDSADYEHFRKTVDAYEATNAANRPASAPPEPAAHAPEAAAPQATEPYGPEPAGVPVAAVQQPSGGGAPQPTEVASRPVSRDELPEDPDGPPVGFY